MSSATLRLSLCVKSSVGREKVLEGRKELRCENSLLAAPSAKKLSLCKKLPNSLFIGSPIRNRPLKEASRFPSGSYERRSAQCALVEKLNSKQLNDLILSDRKVPVVVDFYATWCGPCVLLAQELEQLALEYGDDVKFVRVDTDEEHELASQIEIRGLPTMVFLSHNKGKSSIRTEGLISADTIREIIAAEM